MKNIILLLLLCVALSCKKKQQTTPTPTQSQSSPITTTSNLSTYEQKFVGYWILDSTAEYWNNVRMFPTVSTNSNTCKLDFKTTLRSMSTVARDLIYGINCTPTNQYWEAPDTGYVTLAGIIYPVDMLTSTKLHLTYGLSSGRDLRYYFHK